MCTSAGSILIEIEESTILAQFFRIEIVKKSILEYLPKSAKIEIEQFWNRPSSNNHSIHLFEEGNNLLLKFPLPFIQLIDP